MKKMCNARLNLKFLSLFLMLVLAFCFPRVIEANSFWFNTDGTFKIVQLTDLHFEDGDDIELSEDDLGIDITKNYPYDQNYSGIHDFLIKEQPDMIVITGDILLPGSFKYQKSAQRWIPKYLAPIISYCDMVNPDREKEGRSPVKWAFTMGNHDYEKIENEDGVRQFHLMEVMSNLACSATQFTSNTTFSGDAFRDSKYGQSYLLEIKSSKNHDKVAGLIYMLDSHTKEDHDGGIPKEGWWIQKETAVWFNNTDKKYFDQNNKKSIPSLLFTHVAFPSEYLSGNLIDGVYGERPSGPDTSDNKSIAADLHNSFKSTGNVLGVFFGHDHKNNFYTEYDGVKYGFGNKTILNKRYNPVFAGARVFVLNENDNKNFTTYLRYQYDYSSIASVKEIDTFKSRPYGLALSSDGSAGYVSLESNVICKYVNSQYEELASVVNPFHIATDSPGNIIWIASNKSAFESILLQAVDGNINSFRSIDTFKYCQNGVALNNDASIGYSLSSDKDHRLHYYSKGAFVGDSAKVSGTTIGIATDATGRIVYILTTLGALYSKDYGKTFDTIGFCVNASGLALSKDGKRGYVVDSEGKFYMIKDNRFIGIQGFANPDYPMWKVNGSLTSVATNKDGSLVWVTSYNKDLNPPGKLFEIKVNINDK